MLRSHATNDENVVTDDICRVVVALISTQQLEPYN